MVRLAVISLLTFPCLLLAEVAPSLLVLSKTESKLSIIDLETLQVKATVPTGNSPHEVCVSADGNTAFVADYGASVPGSTITMIDIPAAKVIRTIDIAPLRRPHGIGEFQGKIYFTSETSAAIGRYDPAEDKVDLIVGTGQQGSHMLAIDPADGRIYTTNIGSDSVSAIDPQRGPGGSALTSHCDVAGQPEGIALSPDGRELWAGPRLPGQKISIVETAGDTVKQTIDFDGVPIRMTFTPDGSKVLVSDAKNHSLVVFDAKTKERVGEIKVDEIPIGCIITADGSKAFVSCAAAHKVVAVDLKEMKVIGSIDAGATPDGIAIAQARPAVTPRKPGMLGAQLENLGGADVGRLKLASTQGVMVVNPTPNSPAAAAGLKPDDVIVSINGAPVLNVQNFVRKLQRASAGDELTFDIVRDGEKQAVTVKLAPRPG
ncbi:MAG TPA: PDZ domain-containing protein [Tepidisphaeraceae bacterium]|nr:PDZ domain-containing protein [Tepidisphaeraceae bacterium]